MLFAPIGGDEMRLIHRSRHQRRSRAPRIDISQAEITADLHYPSNRSVVRALDPAAPRRSAGR
jgi:hypothetical protein